MKLLKSIGTVSIVLFFAACATSPRLLHMVSQTESNIFKNSNKILKVEMPAGGQESDPIFAGSRIDNVTFWGALIQTLKKSSLFTQVISTDSADYVMQAQILDQQQPFIGFNMTTTLAVLYSVTDAQDESKVWEREIVSKFTATVGDAFSGAARLNKANEGAVRENFQKLLEHLSKAEFLFAGSTKK